MKKKICAVLLIVCIGSLLCSCYMEDVYDRPDKVIKGSFDCYEWIDPDTGIHYLYDNSGDSCILTPRLNSDGTVMGTEQTKKTKTKTKKVQKKKDKGNKKNDKQK